jgi:predicted nucleotidyltransferase
MDEAVAKELELIKDSVLQVVPDTETIYLFGSYAYGTPHEDSDLDIYVVVPDSVEENPMDLGVLVRRQLRYKRKLPMDLLLGRSSVFNRRKLGLTLENTVAQEGRLLYAAGQ